MMYEVRCPQCTVSFPPDTRSCFYCGTRLRADARHGDLGGLFESEPQRRSSVPFRATVTLLWVLLGVAVTLYRACAGPS